MPVLQEVRSGIAVYLDTGTSVAEIARGFEGPRATPDCGYQLVDRG